jgi:alpha-1,3-fucosyltransferase
MEIDFLKKTKTAAWLISRCGKSSGRDNLTEALKKYIDVDVYGKCGTLPCNNPNCVDFNSYKFYFAFENTFCIDYMSEKTFKVMNSSAIPVSFTGADLRDFLPPKSYIDANSFKTSDDLGNYLKFLSENPKEFVKYFWWKKYYKVEKGLFEVIDYCKYCKKLHEPDLIAESHHYSNIDDWWNKKTCFKPTIKI